jgi:hypothetical protein
VQCAFQQALPLGWAQAHRLAQLFAGWRLVKLATQLGELMPLLLKPAG